MKQVEMLTHKVVDIILFVNLSWAGQKKILFLSIILLLTDP